VTSSTPSTLLPETEDENTPQRGTEPSMFAGVGKHTLVYGLGMLIGRAVSFLMLPIYTRFLTPADYGVMALVELTLDFISILAGAQLALGVFRFYHKVETQREKEEIVSTSFLLVAGMYFMVGLGAFLAAAPLSQLVFGSTEHAILIRIAAFNLTAGALLIVPMSFARVQDRSVLFVGANLVKMLLSLGFVLLFLVWMRLGILGVFLASLLANVIVGGALTVWLYRSVQFSWRRSAATQLLRYGLPLVATQFATWAATFSDRFFLQAVSDEGTVGLYNLAYQFGFIMVVIGFFPVEQVWGPRRFKAAEHPDGDHLLSRGFLLINVLLISVAVAISLFVYDLLRVMATEPFWSAAHVVPVILVAFIFQCWASIQDIGILMSEKTEFITLANFVAAAVAVTGFFFLIPAFGPWGAASATAIAFFVRYALTYAFAQRLWPIRYRWTPVLVLVGWAAVIAAAGLAMPELPIVTSIAARTILGALFLAGIWFLPILTAQDRQYGRAMAWQALLTVKRAATRAP
jgi:O-antigen/teichoic acid export membrane protein